MNIKELLKQRNINTNDVPLDIIYNVGMNNIKDNIEYYFDKKFSCDSVIPELFISGIVDYLKINK
jgi:hypothetical protein